MPQQSPGLFPPAKESLADSKAGKLALKIGYTLKKMGISAAEMRRLASENEELVGINAAKMRRLASENEELEAINNGNVIALCGLLQDPDGEFQQALRKALSPEITLEESLKRLEALLKNYFDSGIAKAFTNIEFLEDPNPERLTILIFSTKNALKIRDDIKRHLDEVRKLRPNQALTPIYDSREWKRDFPPNFRKLSFGDPRVCHYDFGSLPSWVLPLSRYVSLKRITPFQFKSGFHTVYTLSTMPPKMRGEAALNSNINQYFDNSDLVDLLTELRNRLSPLTGNKEAYIQALEAFLKTWFPAPASAAPNDDASASASAPAASM